MDKEKRIPMIKRAQYLIKDDLVFMPALGAHQHL